MALTQAQIDELNKKYAQGTTSKGIYATPEQIKASTSKLSTDPTYLQSEVERANKVRTERLAKGLSVTDQDAYLKKLGTYNQPTVAAPQVNEQEMLAKQLEDAQRRATIAALEKARQQSLGALSQEEAAVQPQFAQQRSQARVTSELGAQSFADFMARRGLASSGGAALGETQRLGALQGTLGGLQQQEQDILANIAQRRTGIEQGYQADLAAAEANLQAQSLQRAIEEAARSKETLARDQELERQRFAQTAGQFASNYQAQINKVLGDNDPTNDWQADILGALRQEKIQEQGLDPITGKAIEQPLTYTVPQALEATRQGFWSQQIADALGLPFTEQARRQATGGGGGAVQAQPTADTGLAGTIVGYTDLQRLLDQGNVRFDDQTKQTVRTDTTPLQKIRQIKDNYTKYVRQYGKDAVEQMVEDLSVQAFPQEQETVEEVQPVNIKDYRDYVTRYLEDESGNLKENEFIDYLERISVSDPDGAAELARIYGYQAY